MSDYTDRLEDALAERGDVAYLHDLHETGDHMPLVETCRWHGRFVAKSWTQIECPACLNTPYIPFRHSPGRER